MRMLRICLAVLAAGAGLLACGRRVASIELSPKKVQIYGVGSTLRMTARLLDKKGRPVDQTSATWSSSKSEVASVDASGLITAKDEGKASITAKFEKVSSQVPVEVIDVKTIELVPVSIQLVGPPGIQFPLQITAKSSKGKSVDVSVQWASSKTNVATVDTRGVVTSVGPGTTTIVAKLGDLQGACDVKVVLRDLARLELRPATAIVRSGDVQQFEVIGFGSDGKATEGLSTVFQTSDPAVAKVDAAGLATGVAPGTATIRVSLGTLTADATLLVTERS